MFDIYTIIFLALAVFIFLRLRSVLGQRTGHERSPYDIAKDAANRASGNVVPLSARPAQPGQVTPPPVTSPLHDVDRWNGIAAADSPVAKGLDAILAQDSSFNVQHFLSGARSAYEMIVQAFAQGDRRTLKDLLASDVYDSFDAAIREREGRGETSETRFVSIDKADLDAAELRGRIAHLTIRFVSKIVSVTRDKSGAVVAGTPEEVTDVTDVWTFARDVTSRDPNWKVVTTESEQ